MQNQWRCGMRDVRFRAWDNDKRKYVPVMMLDFDF